MRDSETYLQTQVKLMMTDRVLDKALANESVKAFPMIKNSEDPNADLRKKIVVEIEPGTYIITVALESKDQNEAAAIVNAVVDSYLDDNLSSTHTRDAPLKEGLREQLSTLREQIERKKTELQKLHQKGNVQIQKPALNLTASKDEDEGDQPTIATVDEQQVKTMMAHVIQNDIDLLTAKADLKARLEIQKSQQEAELEARQDDTELEELIKEAFLKDPEVIALDNQMKVVQEQQEHHKSVIRKKSDAAWIAAQKQLNKLNKDYENLWEIKRGELLKSLRMAQVGRPAGETIAELQHKVRMLQETKDSYARMYEQQKVEQKVTNSDSFQFAYASQELNGLLHREDQVKRTLSQVEFQSSQENFRVNRVDKAQIPKVASNNKRLKYMLAAPIGVLFMALGIFLLWEIKAERVADPDALSTRVRSEVYSLPPLPKSRALRKRDQPTLDAQIEQFIQRLDHLRFAVCGNSVQPGKGRCVLITSAVEKRGQDNASRPTSSPVRHCGDVHFID